MTSADVPSDATDTAARGRALVAARIEQAPALVGRIPDRLCALTDPDTPLPRCLVTTGIGTSEGHARHLAEVASRYCGQPARFASTGSLAAGVPEGAALDWLVVFSQGLSANARYALRDVDSWGQVVLVTGLSPDLSEAEGLSAEKRVWLDGLATRGVQRVDLGCGPEYGALLRVIGARAGYVVSWSLLRTLAHRRLADASVLEIAPAALRGCRDGRPPQKKKKRVIHLKP